MQLVVYEDAFGGHVSFVAELGLGTPLGDLSRLTFAFANGRQLGGSIIRDSN